MAAPPSAEFIHSASTAAPLFGHLGGVMGALLAQDQAASAAHLAAQPSPPLLASSGCDNLLCMQRSSGASQNWVMQVCTGCGVAQYCSAECQRQCWRASFLRSGGGGRGRVIGERAAEKLRREQPQLPHMSLLRFSDGHKEFCGESKLLHAPPPLRLVSRWVTVAGLISVPAAGAASPADCSWWVQDAEGAGAANSHTLARRPWLPASLSPEEPCAADAAAVQRILTRLAPQRLLLAVVHPWRPADPRGDAAYDNSCTLFEVQLDAAAPLRGAALLKLMCAAMAYMFVEEDRLAPGVQYAPGGAPRMGMKVPPLTAESLHYQLDAQERLVGMKPSGPPLADASSASVTLRMLPRLRWGTPKGPFRISEMCMEDVALMSVSFSHLDPLFMMTDERKVQQLHAADRSFVCSAFFRA